jgi:transcriptional regulator with XRE-family HTH domain
MSNYYDMGQRIAKLRREHNLTQERFAELMDISVKHCSAVERGVSTYSYEKLIEVAEFFDCSTDYLLRGVLPDDFSNQIPNTIINIMHSDDEHEKALLREYLRLYVKLRNDRQTSADAKEDAPA